MSFRLQRTNRQKLAEDSIALSEISDTLPCSLYLVAKPWCWH
jgi:hypothetical protein